jgi:hypothetical protein
MTTKHNVPQASADAAYGVGFSDGSSGLPVREFHDPDLFVHYMRGYNDAKPEEVAVQPEAEVELEVDPEAPEPETPPKGGDETKPMEGQDDDGTKEG